MSAIKEIYDLSIDLKNSITDTKQLNIVMSILDKINKIERENLELERSQFELERKHNEEVSSLKSKISNLESQLELKSKPIGPIRIERG